MNLDTLNETVKEGKYLVDFYADWCGPCKAIAPVLEKLEADGEVKIVKINVDHADPLLLAEFGVRAIPTLVAFENGKSINRTTGAQSKEKLMELFS